MSEIGDLIAILGEVDRALGSEDDGRRGQVAALVPPYRTSDTFRWYDSFLAATEADDLPSLDEAMGNLAQPTRYASMLPHRLLAVALAARVFPERFGPGGDEEELSLSALAIPGIVPGLAPVPTPPDDPPDTPGIGDRTIAAQARNLLEVLADPSELEQLEDWRELVAANRDLISDQLARLPSPCSTAVIERPGPGGGGAIAVLQTVLCVSGVTVSSLAGRFLQPANWVDCSPWWCSIDPAPSRPRRPGISRYLEVVALDCPRHVFEVAVFLDFATTVNSPTRAVLTYNLSPDQQGDVGGVRANGAVDVDRGTIEVREDGNHVRVTTTKRVRFTQLVDTAAIAAIACWVGYGDIAADLICDCAGGPADALDCRPAVLGYAPAEVGSPLAEAVDGWVALARSCADEAGAHARAVATSLDTGAYTPDTAARDASRTVALLAQGWAKVVTQSARAVQVIARPPRPADVVSRPFSFATAVADECTLALERPLRSPFGDEIQPGQVRIVPRVLASGEREFRLAIDSAEVEGSYYTGNVVATSAAAPLVVGHVPVDVVVP